MFSLSLWQTPALPYSKYSLCNKWPHTTPHRYLPSSSYQCFKAQTLQRETDIWQSHFLLQFQQTATVATQSQQNPVSIQPDTVAHTQQEQAAGSTAPQAPVVQLQLPQDQINLAHLMQNVGHGTLPLTVPLTQLLASKWSTVKGSNVAFKYF